MSRSEAGSSARVRADERFVRLGRIGLVLGLLLAWALGGRLGDPTWVSAPSLIVLRLVRWAGQDLAVHVATTVAEMAMGLAIGVPIGVLAGIFLGRSPVLSVLLRPIIVGFYSVPLV